MHDRKNVGLLEASALPLDVSGRSRPSQKLVKLEPFRPAMPMEPDNRIGCYC
jgi:hypothetical protein